jgi:outer membrane protein assembly factor BamA
MSKFLPSLLLAFLLSTCARSFPQSQKALAQMPSSARQLTAIKVVGSKRFSEQQIAAASGLQLGAPVNEEDFKKAARRLGDMGVFTDIAYSYSYSSAGTKLEFHVTDADKFVPVRFEDFVWFTDDELMRRIKEYAPLFDGQLPLSGRLPQEIDDVLQAMLVERSIPGHVEYVRAGKSDGPIDSIVYSVADVAIQIRNVEFTGAADAEIPALKQAAKRVTDREYSRSILHSLVEHELLPVYRSRGYLKAAFGEPQPKVVKQPAEQSEDSIHNLTIVDVVFPVAPGVQYTLTGIEWSGNQEIPTDTLRKMVHSEVGRPANTVRIYDNLKDVQRLYSARGYVTASITANPVFDDSARTVTLHMQVKEGSVYHMGELEFRGLDNSLTARLRNAWKLRPGDVYDADYLDEYLPAAQKLLPSNFDWEVSPHVTANQRDKSVDVDLIYTVKATK